MQPSASLTPCLSGFHAMIHSYCMQVYALVDRDGTCRKVMVQKLLTGLLRPNGVAWHGGNLFVAEAGQITRFDNVDTYALAGQVS